MLVLTLEKVIPYLLNQKLSSTKKIVLDEICILDISRRHNIFAVTHKNDSNILLKQGIGNSRSFAINHEAKVYEHLSKIKGSELNQYIPRCLGFDIKNSILIIEYFDRSESFQDYHQRTNYFSLTLSRSLAKALAKIHSCSNLDSFPNSKHISSPWILSIHRPSPNLLKEASYSNVELIKIIQEHSDFCSLLDILNKGWKKEGIIHHDIKWDNILALSSSVNGPRTQVKLIDWELARIGDSDWDVGSIFANYLSFWLQSIPITDASSPAKYLKLASCPIEIMQPAIRAFWLRYIKERGYSNESSILHLLRSTQFAGARLLQSTYEMLQTAPTLNSNTIARIQLCLNILKNPEQAALHLLGLSPLTLKL